MATLEKNYENRSVVSAATGCFEAYRSLMSRPLDQAAAHDTTELANQFDRLKIWAGSVGVFASTTASIDYRLREHAALRGVIVTLLARLLRAVLDQSHDTTRSTSFGSTRAAEDPAESTATSHTATRSPASSCSSLQLSSDSDNAAETAVSPRNDALVWQHDSTTPLQLVRDTINRLYRLSAMIRLPLRHMGRAQVEEFTRKNPEAAEEGADVATFARFKIRRLAGQGSGAQVPEFLVDRLAHAVAFRRRRFLYRQKHSEKLRAQPGTHPGGPAVLSASSLESGTTAMILPRNFASTSKIAMPMLGAKSIAQSKILSATVASHYDPNSRAYAASATSGQTSRSVANRRKNHDIPVRPEPRSGANEIICPYCCIPIQGQELGDVSWRRHVLKDLSCYVCLFEPCGSADVLFDTADEAFDHMLSTHCLVWTCRTDEHAALAFTSPKQLEQHLLSEHRTAVVDDQLDWLVRKGSHPVTDPFPICPMCFDDLQQVPEIDAPKVGPAQRAYRMQQHIAQHLEEIALLSLPPREDWSVGASDQQQAADSDASRDSTVEDDPIAEDLEDETPNFDKELDNVPDAPADQLSWALIEQLRPSPVAPPDDPTLRPFVLSALHRKLHEVSLDAVVQSGDYPRLSLQVFRSESLYAICKSWCAEGFYLNIYGCEPSLGPELGRALDSMSRELFREPIDSRARAVPVHLHLEPVRTALSQYDTTKRGLGFLSLALAFEIGKDKPDSQQNLIKALYSPGDFEKALHSTTIDWLRDPPTERGERNPWPVTFRSIVQGWTGHRVVITGLPEEDKDLGSTQRLLQDFSAWLRRCRPSISVIFITYMKFSAEGSDVVEHHHAEDSVRSRTRSGQLENSTRHPIFTGDQVFTDGAEFPGDRLWAGRLRVDRDEASLLSSQLSRKEARKAPSSVSEFLSSQLEGQGYTIGPSSFPGLSSTAQFGCFVDKADGQLPQCQGLECQWPDARTLAQSPHLERHCRDGDITAEQLSRVKTVANIGSKQEISEEDAWIRCFLCLYPEFQHLESQLNPYRWKTLLGGMAAPKPNEW